MVFDNMGIVSRMGFKISLVQIYFEKVFGKSDIRKITDSNQRSFKEYLDLMTKQFSTKRV